MHYPHYQGDCPHLQSYLELGSKYHIMCAHALLALYFLLSPHDLKKLRIIKEYFMGKVMLGFIGSNSNMALYGYLNLPSITSCTSPNSKKAFDSSAWNSCGKEHCHGNSIWEIFSRTFVSSMRRWWEYSVNMVCTPSIPLWFHESIDRYVLFLLKQWQMFYRQPYRKLQCAPCWHAW